MLLYYDYLLMLPLEVSEMWSQRLSGVKVLYFTNRYMFLLWTILQSLYVFLSDLTDDVRDMLWLHVFPIQFLTILYLQT